MEVTRFTINTPGLDTTGSELAEIRAAFQQMSLEVSQFRQEVRQRSPSPYSALAHRRSSSRLSKASHILDNCLLFPDMPKIVGVTTTSDSGQPLASVTLFVLSTGWETSRPIACSGKRSRPNLHPYLPRVRLHCRYPVFGRHGRRGEHRARDCLWPS